MIRINRCVVRLKYQKRNLLSTVLEVKMFKIKSLGDSVSVKNPVPFLKMLPGCFVLQRD